MWTPGFGSAAFGRIMITWGIVASATAFIDGARSFYALRFVLGVTEAGFQPGVVFFLSQWFPKQQRAEAVATFNSSIPLAVALAAPVTGALIGAMNGVLGIAGWRWVLFLEGLPSIALGLWTVAALPEQPERATWLAEHDRAALRRVLDAEAVEAARHRARSWIADGRLWAFSGLFLLLAAGGYGVVFWMPQIINAVGKLTPFQVGGLTAIPFLCAFLAMRAIARISDRTEPPRAVVAGCAALAGRVCCCSRPWHRTRCSA